MTRVVAGSELSRTAHALEPAPLIQDGTSQLVLRHSHRVARSAVAS
jgi:hypothetical protein